MSNESRSMLHVPAWEVMTALKHVCPGRQDQDVHGDTTADDQLPRWRASRPMSSHGDTKIQNSTFERSRNVTSNCRLRLKQQLVHFHTVLSRILIKTGSGAPSLCSTMLLRKPERAKQPLNSTFVRLIRQLVQF